MVLNGAVAGHGPRFRGETVVSRPPMHSVGQRHSSQSQALLFSCAVRFSTLI